MKKMEAKKQQKRAYIIAAAQETFRTDGYIGASMDGIAGRAGVTKQTVYRYFGSKAELFQAALEAQRAETPRDYLAALELEDTAEALLGFAVGFLEVHMSEPHLAAIRLLIAEGPTAPEITRAFFAGGPKTTTERLAGFLSRRFGIEDAEFAAKALLSTLLAMRMNVLTGLIEAPSQEELWEHAQQTVALFSGFFH